MKLLKLKWFSPCLQSTLYITHFNKLLKSGVREHFFSSLLVKFYTLCQYWCSLNKRRVLVEVWLDFKYVTRNEIFLWTCKFILAWWPKKIQTVLQLPMQNFCTSHDFIFLYILSFSYISKKNDIHSLRIHYNSLHHPWYANVPYHNSFSYLFCSELLPRWLRIFPTFTYSKKKRMKMQITIGVCEHPDYVSFKDA